MDKSVNLLYIFSSPMLICYTSSPLQLWQETKRGRNLFCVGSSNHFPILLKPLNQMHLKLSHQNAVIKLHNLWGFFFPEEKYFSHLLQFSSLPGCPSYFYFDRYFFGRALHLLILHSVSVIRELLSASLRERVSPSKLIVTFSQVPFLTVPPKLTSICEK